MKELTMIFLMITGELSSYPTFKMGYVTNEI